MPLPNHKAIVIGASAGGVEAILTLAKGLPAGFPAALFLVIHTSPASPGYMADMINRVGPVPALYARDGEIARPGDLYIAPADQHLILEPGPRMRVWRGPKENGFRPAIDPLFRSVARLYGPQAIGVILSGYLDDGTLGLMLLKRRGGVAVVQDPSTAACANMPRSAIENVNVDYVVPVAEMPALFARLVEQPTAQPLPTGATDMGADFQSGSEQRSVPVTPNSIELKEKEDGSPSALSCPECGGAMWEQRVDNVLRYSCHVGHGYTGETLEEQYIREVEAALWTALRQLVESAELHRRLATRMRETGPADRAEAYEQRALEAKRRAQVVRELLVNDRVSDLVGRMGVMPPTAQASPPPRPASGS